MSWRWLPVLALASACGDNLSGGPVDGGAIDARHFADASRAACEPDAGCGDEPLTPVCDAERGICVECLAEIDCAREQAFGPRCDESAGYCQCADDSDCEGNPNGPWCNQVVHACTCLLDEDCGGDTTCEMEPYLGGGVRACRGGPTGSSPVIWFRAPGGPFGGGKPERSLGMGVKSHRGQTAGPSRNKFRF